MVSAAFSRSVFIAGNPWLFFKAHVENPKSLQIGREMVSCGWPAATESRLHGVAGYPAQVVGGPSLFPALSGLW
jgi:hypothetical protein